jgi:hypothetical protein
MKLIATISVFIMLILPCAAQQDTALKRLETKLDQLSSKQTATNEKVENLEKRQSQASAAGSNAPVAGIGSNAAKECKEITGWKGWLVAGPILLFLIAVCYIILRLRKEGYSLSEMLSTMKSQSVRTIKTVSPDGTTSTVQEEDPSSIQLNSTSRTIAFLTGITALIIAITITTYMGYMAIAGCDKSMELDDIWKLLLALGIGVVPYGANVIGGNPKEQPPKP